MKIEVELEKVDYDNLIDVLMPVLAENAEKKKLPFGGLLGKKNTKKAAKKVASLIPDDKKEAYVVKTLNKNSRKIVHLIEDAAGKNGVKVRVKRVRIR